MLNSNTVTGDYGYGGALYAHSSPITINASTLSSNTLSVHNGAGGGAVLVYSSPITTVNSILNNNTVTGDYAFAGAVYADTCPNTTIVNSTLNSNTVTGNHGYGGALYTDTSTHTTIISSILNGNTVQTIDRGIGGAIYILAVSDLITIINSTLSNNSVSGDGGAVLVHTLPDNFTLGPMISAENCTFSNNSCTGKGSGFHLVSVTFYSSGFLDFQNNTAIAGPGVFYAEESTIYFSSNITVSKNHGSLFFDSCNVTFMEHTNIVNNSYSFNTSDFDEGGALTTFQSEIVFIGTVKLMYNRAIRGGAITAATQSKLYMYGPITVSHNIASVSGGGIYSSDQSELNFHGNIIISRNSAYNRGGGIHAIGSTTLLTGGSSTYIVGNHAERGGGMCLEGYAKMKLLKTKQECLQPPDDGYDCISNTSSWITLRLNNNTADYGGAVYIADDTTSATCSATPFSGKTTIYNECFIQELGQYTSGHLSTISEQHNLINTYFTSNSAAVAGAVLYGGLLDRCKINSESEILKYKSSTPSSLSAVSYLLNITDLEIQDFNSSKLISSDPVRVCFCRDNQPDCSYHPQPKYVRKEERFTVSLVAVDHVNNSIVSSTIHASTSLEAKLGEGQSIQQTSGDGSCTYLTYSLISPNNSGQLYLYADGPCKNAGISTATLTVNLTPNCPIGFKYKNFHCDCDPILYPEYITDCFRDSETLQRKDNVWFSYMNTTHHQGYLLHKHCPFDYCYPPTENISVNLNIKNGADEMCALNRSGKLCGSCENGLSLSLGSSRCRPCSNNWFALLIGFAVAGVILVAFILKVNFTVAEGTFNGLIFYANIFVANRATLFPRDQTVIVSTFIAWLNLDFGFETCFYDGMDGYAKTWLQLAFPLYVISLVVAIIIISDYSTKFARLFTGKNPIATLATLILLSYTKLLRTIIASLSFTTIQYSDGSHEVVWLIDANIPYLSGKHIPLFAIATTIVIVGTGYTFILFAWQWLVYCPNRGPLRWIIGNTKVIAFLDAYHNPYNKDHRYWIGLLLLVRVLLYLVSSLNVLGDPRINLLTIAIVTVILVFFQLLAERKHKIHQRKICETLERISLLNLAVLTIATLFNTEDKDSQNVVAYISTGIAFVLFLAIIVYHVYLFVLSKLFSKISTKLHILQGKQNQTPVDSSTVSAIAIDDEEPVSVTEINALPEPIDTLEDEKTGTDDDSEDIELAGQEGKNIPNDSTECYQPLLISFEGDNGPTVNGSKLTHVEIESPITFVSHSQGNPTSDIPASHCDKQTTGLVEIELPNLASGCELSVGGFFKSSSMLVETRHTLRDDHYGYESFEEDESAPLLPQDHDA